MNAFQRTLGLVIFNCILSAMSYAQAGDWQAKKAEFHQKYQAACGADEAKLCPGQEGRNARECMHANKAQLSAGCTSFLAEMKQKMQERRGAEGKPTN
jgi:hypothetical protein